MIARAGVGAARLVFGAALLAGILAAGLAYLAYRLLRKATVGDRPAPVRMAGFEVIRSLVSLAAALKAEAARRGIPIEIPEGEA